ncbi:MAG: hypothetical protein M1820_008456 [Bogoriella megaspora]|nr:MAG: hypothetical protein M1820_008456 [Bogoriella megaspora]
MTLSAKLSCVTAIAVHCLISASLATGLDNGTAAATTGLKMESHPAAQTLVESGSSSTTTSSSAVPTNRPSDTASVGDIGDMIASGLGMTKSSFAVDTFDRSKSVPLVPNVPITAEPNTFDFTFSAISQDSAVSEPQITAVRSQSDSVITVFSMPQGPAMTPSQGSSGLSAIQSPSQQLRHNNTDGSSANGTRSPMECWTQWNSFWSSTAAAEAALAYGVWHSVMQASLYTLVTTSYWTSYDHGFPIATYAATATVSEHSFPSASEISNFPDAGAISTPACTLPAHFSQCQSQWDDWFITHFSTVSVPFECTYPFTFDNPPATALDKPWPSECLSWNVLSVSLNEKQSSTPWCTQATMANYKCNSLRSSYLSSWKAANPTALSNIGYYTPYFPFTISNGLTKSEPYWQPDMRFGADCTLGCGQCTITANTVQLHYWPQTKSNATAEHPITVSAFNTSFVSPTAYVFYSRIYASDSCGGTPGSIHLSTFLPVNTLDLSSIWVDLQPPSDGGYPKQVTNTASFNITDLNTPVPASIYKRQPWCADFGKKLSAVVLDSSVEYDCPQTRPYDPILVVPLKSIQAIDPAWSDCAFDGRGSYDPPYDLQQAPLAAVPTSSSVNLMPTQTAAPAPVPTLAQPSHTYGSTPSSTSSSISNDPGNDPGFPTSDPGVENDPDSDPSSKGPRPNPSNSLQSQDSSPLASSDSTARPGPARPQSPAKSHHEPEFTGEDPGNEVGDGIVSYLSNGAQATPDPDLRPLNSDPGNAAAGAIGQIMGGSPAHPLDSASGVEAQIPTNPWSNSLVLNTPVATGNIGGSPSASDKFTSSQNAQSQHGSSSPTSPSGWIHMRPSSSDVHKSPNANHDGNRGGELVANPTTSGIDSIAESSAHQSQAKDGPEGIVSLLSDMAASSNTRISSLDSFLKSNERNSFSQDTTSKGGSTEARNTRGASSASNPASDTVSVTAGLLVPFTVSGFAYTAVQTNILGHDKGVVITYSSSVLTLWHGGSAAMINGKYVSMAASGLVVNGKTESFVSKPTAERAAAFTVSGTEFTASGTSIPGHPNAVEFSEPEDKVTLWPGASVVTVGGQLVSAASSGLVIGGRTETYSTVSPSETNGGVSGDSRGSDNPEDFHGSSSSSSSSSSRGSANTEGTIGQSSILFTKTVSMSSTQKRGKGWRSLCLWIALVCVGNEVMIGMAVA